MQRIIRCPNSRINGSALAYEVTKDERLEKKAKELIDGLYEVQQKYTAMSEEYEGYLSAYPVSQFSDLEKGAVYPAVSLSSFVTS